MLVVGADPARAEPHAQEQAVDPVDLVLGDQPLDQRPCHRELVPARLPAIAAHLAGREVDDDLLVVIVARGAVDPQQHRPADPGPDVAGQFQQRLEPRLELGEHIHARRPPAAPVRLNAGPHPIRVIAQVAFLVGEWPQRISLSGGPTDAVFPVLGFERRARHQQLSAGNSARAQITEENSLIRECAGLISGEVVEREQLVIEETRGPGAGNNAAGADRLRVPCCPLQPVGPLRRPERALRLRWQLVCPRPPDRPRELQEMRVERAECEYRVEVGGP
ncbi:MAG TPA: hypothetical protein VE343_15880, partial [Streptosporangiaceae bacterium]|nr:hypothetical protein [Streptosporangiaceae bacterium]